MKYRAVIGGIRKDSVRYNWVEGEDKCDMQSFDKSILFSNVVSEDGRQLGNLWIKENKTISRSQVFLFVGNTIVFEATEKDGVLSRVRNICGNRVDYIPQLDENWCLVQGVVPHKPDPSHCYHCGHRKDCMKGNVYYC